MWTLTLSIWLTEPSASAKVFLLVSLRDPGLDVAAFLSAEGDSSARCVTRQVGEGLTSGARRVMTARKQTRAARADQARARARRLPELREVRGIELQWLVRRAFCRGLGEPVVDGLHEPRALAFERDGQCCSGALEGDVMRSAEGCVEHVAGLYASSPSSGPVGRHNSWSARCRRVSVSERRGGLMFAPAGSVSRLESTSRSTDGTCPTT